ncbi:MAG TPA: acyl-CoA dehydrogenase family protein [Abditibacterium sp.]|jgi:hypothetical protein
MQTATLLPPIADEQLWLGEISDLVARDLAPQVVEIDQQGRYPRQLMRDLGEQGVMGRSCPPQIGGVGGGLKATLQAMETVSRECMSTGFCLWCQWVCGWYIQNGDSDFLKTEILPLVLSGQRMGATGMSNPMKHFAGIENLNLSAKREDGGFRVSGALPWVSNVASEGFFACVARVEGGADGDYLMAIVPGDAPGLTLGEGGHFVALEGSSTYSAIFRDVFIADDWVLAHPCGPYIQRIRPGFILGQTGFGLGVIAACLEIMQRANKRTGHVNCFLDDRAEHIEADLDALRTRIYALADEIGVGQSAAVPSKELVRGCVQARLDTSELALRASQAALLHAGAGGYRAGGAVDRKLRESYFVAIVTPATKHLKKLLSTLE